MSLIIFLVLAIAAFMLWHFVPQKPKEPPKPAPRYRRDFRISAEQVDWQSFAEEHCESPAEIAFLRGMISTLGMRPHLGALVSEGVRLDFQVEEGRYRVDFLVNHWLVVEIDGAAYHSSAEVKIRDGMRDRYLENLGYSVLRIPAKLVFRNPKQAVDQVQSALLGGRREIPTPAPAVQGGFARLAQTAASFSNSVEMSEKKQAIRLALADATAALSAEEATLNTALKSASDQMEHQVWVSSLDADVLECYQQSVRDLRAVSAQVEQKSNVGVNFRKFQRPPPTGDAWVDEHVSAAFGQLEVKRASAVSKVKDRMRQNQTIRPYLEDALKAFGRTDLWEEIR